jgi:hypothetical protein
MKACYCLTRGGSARVVERCTRREERRWEAVLMYDTELGDSSDAEGDGAVSQ